MIIGKYPSWVFRRKALASLSYARDTSITTAKCLSSAPSALVLEDASDLNAQLLNRSDCSTLHASAVVRPGWALGTAYVYEPGLCQPVRTDRHLLQTAAYRTSAPSFAGPKRKCFRDRIGRTAQNRSAKSIVHFTRRTGPSSACIHIYLWNEKMT